ncbi:MAG: type II toxin-antitoxin system HicA family toxin [Deltaproteobacteria bacterium]|nr:type II toxin-antitoxin system HicA family toxin [Deltaproteobacteria bacterium]
MTKRCRELLAKARQHPSGLRFAELCRLCECIGMACVRSRGSHRIYRRESAPVFSLSAQEGKNGEAKPYQVRELLELVDLHGLEGEGTP